MTGNPLNRRLRSSPGRIALLMLWTCLSVPCCVSGDENETSTVARLLDLDSPAPASPSIQELALHPPTDDPLDQVRALLNQLGHQNEPTAPDPFGLGDTSFQSILQQIQETESETARQVGQISDRLKTLMSMERERAELTRSAEQPGPQIEEISDPPPTADLSQDSAPIEHQISDTTSDAQIPDELPPVVPPAAFHTEKVLSRPPDQLALADNLYQTGEFALALDLYREMQTQGAQADQVAWIQYQIAGCLRHRNQVDEALKLYREIANGSDDEHLIQMSQWWLDMIAKRSQLTAQIKFMDQFIQKSRKDHSHVKSIND